MNKFIDLDDDDLGYVLTVPTIWGNNGKRFLREAAVKVRISETEICLCLSSVCRLVLKALSLCLSFVKNISCCFHSLGLLNGFNLYVLSTIFYLFRDCSVSSFLRSFFIVLNRFFLISCPYYRIEFLNIHNLQMVLPQVHIVSIFPSSDVNCITIFKVFGLFLKSFSWYLPVRTYHPPYGRFLIRS